MDNEKGYGLKKNRQRHGKRSLDGFVKIKATILKSGGKITQDIFEFPVGKRFHFSDPSGNELAV
ncbi:MAG: putative enzyme related to lactoylglutathione lyase [Bacteroidia bacterium]|jgi:predicted enzyme related to lactoylglutathione lyase